MSKIENLVETIKAEAKKIEERKKKQKKESENENAKKENEDENIIIPEYVKIAWNDLSPSIASVFRSSKWKSKYASFKIFKIWFEEKLKGDSK